MIVGLLLLILLFGPLLLLGFYVIADRFGWPIAIRILDAFAVTLTAQFVIGALINIALGIALAAAAIWMMHHSTAAWRFPAAATAMFLGLWRIGREAAILWGSFLEKV